MDIYPLETSPHRTQLNIVQSDTQLVQSPEAQRYMLPGVLSSARRECGIDAPDVAEVPHLSGRKASCRWLGGMPSAGGIDNHARSGPAPRPENVLHLLYPFEEVLGAGDGGPDSVRRPHQTVSPGTRRCA